MGESGATRALVDQLSSILGKNQINIYDQHLPKDNKFRLLFGNASKRFTGNQGFPDLIVEFRRTKNNPRNLLIISECKKKIKDHCISNQPLATDCPDRYACSGALHYLKCAHQARLDSKKPHLINLDMIGIAYTKDTFTRGGEEKVDIYGINSRFNETSLNIRHFEGKTIKDLPHIISELYSLSTLNTQIWTRNYNQSQLGILPIKELVKIRFKYEIGAKNKHKYKFQRELAEFKVNGIYDYYYNEAWKNKENGPSISPQGIILLGRYDNDYFVLDGQHRLIAFKKLYNKDLCNFEVLFQLTTYVVPSKMVDDFKAHNSGSGLTTTEYEYTSDLQEETKMEETVSTLDEKSSVKKIVDDLDHTQSLISAVTKVCDYYATTYLKFFKQSPNCYSPHIHYETMKAELQRRIMELKRFNKLYGSELIEAIKKAINKLNLKIKQEYKNDTTALAGVYNKCVQKGGFYVGIIKKCEWVDRII